MSTWKLVLGCTLLAAMAAGAGAAGDGASRVFPPVAELKPVAELPDPLTMLDGRRVTSRRQWEEERRPELKLLFQHYMYGVWPDPEPFRAVVEREDPEALGGKATLREVTLRFQRPEIPPIHVLQVVPNKREGKVAAFVGISFAGNHSVLKDPRIRLSEAWQYPTRPGVVNNRATEESRGSQVDIWNVEKVIDRGYAIATFYNGDVQPDNAALAEKATHWRGDTATVARWAWGISRVVDYMVADPRIDAKRIAAVGHSRNGKASLVAAAFDERIALAIPNQAGCGGTAPSRGKIGESVTRINTSFPHWFNANFKLFNDRPELIPFDQHCLVALVAPRPVLFSNAEEDTWANPEGQFEVLKAADPVYRLLGVEGLGMQSRPPMSQLLVSRLGYFIRPGKHSMTTLDWDAYLDFADRHLKKR